MGRITTAEGMQVQAFAAHLGKSVQWARKLKRENSQEWQEFIAVAPVKPEPVPVLRAHGADDDLSRALDAKERAWMLFIRAADAAAACDGDMVQQVALNRAAKEAREVYERACKHAAACQIEAQRWVSISQVSAIRDALGQLADVVQNWETTLAGALPDDMRPAFHDAFQRSKPAWNGGVKKVDDYIQTLLPVPC